jgi:hypothetical protein
MIVINQFAPTVTTMIEIKNNRIIYTIKAGTDTALVLKSSDLPEFDEVRLDLKVTDRLDTDPLYSFSNLDGGLTLLNEGADIIIVLQLTNQITASLRTAKLFFDIKFRFGNLVSDIVVPGEIILKNTVTRI